MTGLIASTAGFGWLGGTSLCANSSNAPLHPSGTMMIHVAPSEKVPVEVTTARGDGVEGPVGMTVWCTPADVRPEAAAIAPRLMTTTIVTRRVRPAPRRWRPDLVVDWVSRGCRVAV